MTFLVATGQALLIARRASQWSVEEHLRGHSPECVAVDPINPSRVYCGTWGELPGLRSLPSARTWSFPPRPDTHHVRWIEPDPAVSGRVFVAIEAGALVRTLDGGQTWMDRVRGGPYDTHTAATHPLRSEEH